MSPYHKILCRTILFFLSYWLILPVLAQDELDTTLYNKAEALIETGKYMQAVEMYQLFINSGSPNDEKDWARISQSWNNIGVAYYLLQEFDKATLSFESALIIDKNNQFDTYSERLSNLGMVYKKRGYYQRAVSYY